MKRMKNRLLLGAVVVGAFAIIGASPAMAAKKPGGGTTSAACPKGNANLPTDNNVGAFATPISGGFKYFFTSTDQNPSGGVPGLVKYCVYPTDAGAAPVADATYDDWVASTSSRRPYNFAFGRPGGNDTNVPLDGEGNPVEIGTATWTNDNAPKTQDIVLHVADPSVCGTSPTCFVKPNPGPVCDVGVGPEGAAYNAIPLDFPECAPPPSLGFECCKTSEFGDRVKLDTTAGNKLQSMTVDFQSFGCATSGHWNTAVDVDGNPDNDPADGIPDDNLDPDPCVTDATDPQTFTIPASGGDSAGITAHIYELPDGDGDTSTDVGAEIASATYTDPIPYRPSADATNCTGADAGKFVGPAGVCVNSLPVPITFDFSGGPTLADDQEVIWTVTFNTTHEGYHPIGEQEPCFGSSPPAPTAPGCGYDSLNVGAKTYDGAPYPYSGTDAAADLAIWNDTVPADKTNLLAQGGWTNNKPLGQIVTGP
jgi:hypothetical protein